MEKFYRDANIWDIGQNLLVLSLDAIRPALGLLRAPSLVDADYKALKGWTEIWPSFEFFPYSDDTPFDTTLTAFNQFVSKERAAELIHWSLLSTPLTDPSTDHSSDRPANAAYQWRTALEAARDLGRLAALDLSDIGHKNLLTILKQFEDWMKPAEDFAETLAKEWEPYPDDPGQWKYNIMVKSEWDRRIYQTFCQDQSFSLRFDFEFTVRDQQTHRFVRDYAQHIPPADHAIIRRDLADVLLGQGHFALQPWQIDRLREYDDAPIESLLRFTRDPL